MCSTAWQKRHHEHWGRLYEVKDVNIDWHLPSEDEINWVVELLREVVEPALNIVQGLLESDDIQGQSAVWTNDFCRVSTAKLGHPL